MTQNFRLTVLLMALAQCTSDHCVVHSGTSAKSLSALQSIRRLHCLCAQIMDSSRTFDASWAIFNSQSMHWGHFRIAVNNQAPRDIRLNGASQLVAKFCAGDVALHALTDAILGTLCLPDIGQLFPDTDPKWKGANSDTFIREAVCQDCHVFLCCSRHLCFLITMHSALIMLGTV